jgi:hypothetical protein
MRRKEATLAPCMSWSHFQSVILPQIWGDASHVESDSSSFGAFQDFDQDFDVILYISDCLQIRIIEPCSACCPMGD